MTGIGWFGDGPLLGTVPSKADLTRCKDRRQLSAGKRPLQQSVDGLKAVIGYAGKVALDGRSQNRRNKANFRFQSQCQYR